MKRNPNYVLRQVAGQNIIVPTGSEAVKFHGILTLNHTGLFLYEALKEDLTAEELISRLTDTFAVSEERARADVEEFLKTLREKNLLT